jgi:hypothetical protein
MTLEAELLRQSEDFHSRVVMAEFTDLPQWCKDGFANTAQANGAVNIAKLTAKKAAVAAVGAAPASYAIFRATLWRAGHRNVHAWLHDHITKGSLLGVPITGGIHRNLAAKLEAAGLAKARSEPQSYTPGIKTVVGFQPRLIYGTGKVSEHAWGAALDIDASWNPQIGSPGRQSDATVLQIIQAHTGADLAKPLFPNETPTPEMLATRLREISDALKVWTAEALQAEKVLTDDVKSRSQAVDQARKEVKAAKPGADRDAAKARLVVAEEARSVAAQTLANHQGARDLATLRQKQIGVERWAKEGILTLPVGLILRLVDEVGLEWGAEWAGSKDLMHFELRDSERRNARQAPLQPAVTSLNNLLLR